MFMFARRRRRFFGLFLGLLLLGGMISMGGNFRQRSAYMQGYDAGQQQAVSNAAQTETAAKSAESTTAQPPFSPYAGHGYGHGAASYGYRSHHIGFFGILFRVGLFILVAKGFMLFFFGRKHHRCHGRPHRGNGDAEAEGEGEGGERTHFGPPWRRGFRGGPWGHVHHGRGCCGQDEPENGDDQTPGPEKQPEDVDPLNS